MESRDQMISFGLTKKEYDRCREVCFSQGIRSVSEMARAGINRLLQEPAQASDGALESRVAELEGRVHILGLQLKELSQSAALDSNRHQLRIPGSPFATKGSPFATK